MSNRFLKRGIGGGGRLVLYGPTGVVRGGYPPSPWYLPSLLAPPIPPICGRMFLKEALGISRTASIGVSRTGGLLVLVSQGLQKVVTASVSFSTA